MTDLYARVQHLFGLSIESKISAADTMAADIVKASDVLVQCFLNDGKILLGGHGASAANCLHFSAAMLNHFEVERPSLPVITLSMDISAITALANDGLYDQIFARQISALGQQGDVLLLLSSSGHSENVLNALHAAHERGMDVVALLGGDESFLVNHLGPSDVKLHVTADKTAHIHELHLLILHCFCDLIDQSLFGT